jgi:hypothetical protein
VKGNTHGYEKDTPKDKPLHDTDRKEQGVFQEDKSWLLSPKERRTNKNGNFGHTFSFVLGLRL